MPAATSTMSAAPLSPTTTTISSSSPSLRRRLSARLQRMFVLPTQSAEELSERTRKSQEAHRDFWVEGINLQ